MRINNPKNMHNEELLSKIYVDSNVFQGDGTKNNVLKLKIDDYTAYEVFAHNYDIPVGECEELGGYVYEAIPAEMQHYMNVRIKMYDPKQSDVIIDWGDGTIQHVSECMRNKKPASQSEYDTNCTVRHTYSKTGKYIVKIYGKDYYAICSSRTGANGFDCLICRIFDKDLPIASHVTNISSFARLAPRLLKVRLPEYSDVSRFLNWSYLVRGCSNLSSFMGFENICLNATTVQGMFHECRNLKECDFTIPTVVSRGQIGIMQICKDCGYVDIETLLGSNAMDASVQMNVKEAFNGATFKEGTIIPADKLWNDKTKTWLNTQACFSNCSDDIRSQVPVSWGGTNQNIDNELLITDEMKSDYTAFEVFAHDYDIPVGECEELGGYVNYELPANMIHQFVLRSDYAQNEQDVIVDWGDGVIEKLIEKTPTGSEGDFRYELSHTYSISGKYIVKIFGKCYFGILNNSTYSNIICRLFDYDLPIASHLSNFASFGRYSQHLLNVDLNRCPSFNKQFSNISNLFSSSKNLLSAIGFGIRNKSNISYGSALYYCYSLQTTDLSIGNNLGSIASIFTGDTNLACDINNLLLYFNPTNNTTISVLNLFKSCSKLYGTVPADKLWNNKNINWTNTDNCFTDCSDEIRAQVPTSWGGTNKNIDVELSITDEMKKDYIAFEVFAHDYEIPSGTLVKDTPLSSTLTEETDVIANTLPAQMAHRFKIKSTLPKEQQNVIIDWGDNSIAYLNTTILSSDSEGFWVEHEYATSGKYIIKIYGNTYTSFVAAATATTPNILCRILEKDLPVASHLTNFSSFAKYSKHLLYVNIDNINFSNNWKNCADMFNACTNLIKVVGFNCDNKINCIYNNAFQNCKSLVHTDFSISPTNHPLNSIFRNCQKLTTDINLLISNIASFNSSEYIINALFYNCKVLSGTVPGDKLWNNQDINWTNYSKCFTGTSAEIKAQVPKSWGGTAEDSTLIVPTQEEKIVYLQSRVDQNFQSINNKQEIITGIRGEFVVINDEGKAEATSVTLPSTSLFVNHVDNLDNPVEEQLNKIVIYTGESTNDINEYIKGHIYQCSSYLDAGLSSLEFLNGFYTLGGTYNNQSYYVKEFDGSKYYIYWAGDELNFWVLTKDLLGDIIDKRDNVLFISNTGLDSLTDIWRDDDVNYSNNTGELPPRMELVFNWNDITSCANLESSVSQMEQRLSTLEAVAARLANI